MPQKKHRQKYIFKNIYEINLINFLKTFTGTNALDAGKHSVITFLQIPNSYSTSPKHGEKCFTPEHRQPKLFTGK